MDLMSLLQQAFGQLQQRAQATNAQQRLPFAGAPGAGGAPSGMSPDWLTSLVKMLQQQGRGGAAPVAAKPLGTVAPTGTVTAAPNAQPSVPTSMPTSMPAVTPSPTAATATATPQPIGQVAPSLHLPVTSEPTPDSNGSSGGALTPTSSNPFLSWK